MSYSKKYTNKIKSFLKIIDNNPIKLSINKYDIIDKIHKSAKYSIEKKHDIQFIEKQYINPIHHKNDYPLLYIFFRTLKEHNLMDQIYPDTPDITEFRIFVDWYRENIHFIDFNKIHKLMNNVENISLTDLVDIYKSIYKVTGSRKILHDSIYENTFISWDIQHDIESSILEYTKYIIDNKHNVNIFVPKTKEHIAPDINIVATIICMMENLAKSQNKDLPVVNLTILFSSQKKNIYPKTKVLCCDNINSGSTYPGKSIVCWRREEFYKVLIHELFHYYSFDFHYTDPYYQQLENMLLVPKIDGIDMINESYTESFTIIALSILHYTINSKNRSIELLLFMNNFIEREILFLLFQIAKILVVFECDNMDDYINGKILIKQNTSFRSYFIIKMVLLLNINDVLDMMDNALNINNVRIVDYGNLINKSWNSMIKNKSVVYLVNFFINLINYKYANTNKELDWIYKTCRMSVDDILSI